MKKAAGHCMVFSKTDGKVLGYESKAIVLMQMRFDGRLGFAGGEIEEVDGSCAAGVAREMFEELGLDPSKFPLTEEHHVVSNPVEDHPKLDNFHFYALEIPEADILQLEKNVHAAVHYGEEVLGSLRVPLYTMADGYHGFPAFLNNQFAGNCKEQLLLALEKTGILSPQEIEAAKIASENKNVKL